MSRNIKSYCLDFEPQKQESKFSFSNITTQFRQHIKLAAELLVTFVVSGFCLYYFYYYINEKKLDKLTYLTFIISCANAFLDTPFFRDESFCELKILLDYAQEVLPLPFLTADLWMKFEIAPAYVSYLHAAYGLTAFFYLIIFEYKRPDLTDFAIIFNYFSLMGLAIYKQNIFAAAAALHVCIFYIKFKRTEFCFVNNKFISMLASAFFNLCALYSFGPESWLPGEGGEGSED